MTTEPFRLTPWHNEPDESCDPLGLYAETYWAPVLCPTAYVLARRLVILSRRHAARGIEDDLVLDPCELSMALGIGRPAGSTAQPQVDQFKRAMYRIERYLLAHKYDATHCAIRLRWPRLPLGALYKLPDGHQQAEPEFWALEGGPIAATTLSL